MTKEMNTQPGYRFVIAGLLLLTPLCTILPYIAVSALMNDIMQSLHIGYAYAGLTMTIMLVISGACMFVGSAIQDRLGVFKTIILAVWLLACGSGICFFAHNYALLLFGRIVSGIGFGLSSVTMSAYMSTWFKGKERAFMITANLISNSVAGVIAYSIAAPLRQATGSWNGVFGIYAVLIAMIAMLWTVFGRTNAELETAKSARTAIPTGIKQESSLAKAFKIKQYRLLMVSGLFVNFAITAVTAFLPIYLTNGKNFTEEFATFASGLRNIASIAGSIAGGAVVAGGGRRKPFLLSGVGLMLISGLVLTITGSQSLTIVMVLLLGFSFMFMMPPQSTIMMETPFPFDPILLGAGTAIVTGVGQICSLVVSPLFSLIEQRAGITAAMQFFFVLLGVSLVVCLGVRERRTSDQPQYSLQETEA